MDNTSSTNGFANAYLEPLGHQSEARLRQTYFNGRSQSAQNRKFRLRKGSPFGDHQKEIEKENKRLYEKMVNIQSNVGGKYPSMTPKSRDFVPPQKKRHLQKILDDNQKLLKAIETTKSNYSKGRLESDYRQKQGLFKHMHKYPYNPEIYESKRATNETKRFNETFEGTYEDGDGTYGPTKRKSSLSRNNRKKSPYSIRNELDSSREKDYFFNTAYKVIYRTNRLIKDKIYLIEISKSLEDYTFQAYDLESANSYTLALPSKVVSELLHRYNFEYNELLKHLELKRDHLEFTVEKNQPVQPQQREDDFYSTTASNMRGTRDSGLRSKSPLDAYLAEHKIEDIFKPKRYKTPQSRERATSPFRGTKSKMRATNDSQMKLVDNYGGTQSTSFGVNKNANNTTETQNPENQRTMTIRKFLDDAIKDYESQLSHEIKIKSRKVQSVKNTAEKLRPFPIF